MIDGNNIIWIDKRSGGEQIYLYDIAKGKERQITTVKSLKLSPVINGDKIVWIDSRSGEDKWDVYLYNLTSERRPPSALTLPDRLNPGSGAILWSGPMAEIRTGIFTPMT